MTRLVSRGARVLGTVIQYGCLAHCTMEYVGDLVVCDGPSMEPAIRGSDVVLAEHISIRSRIIPKGSVVIVRSPRDPKSFICKRVVAGPGDRVPVPGALTFVPKGYVWLQGDNADNSMDSRVLGPVPFGLVRGRVVVKVWPLADAGLVESKSDPS